MTDLVRPRDPQEVEEAVQRALGGGKTIEIVGHGTKRAIGPPAQTDVTLDLSGLARVTFYEPEELVLSARAGTSIAEIEALVASRGQQLAFEPVDCGPLFGAPVGRGTIGGALAANLAGPRRIKAGAARDHVLGFSAVSGRGETFKSGGRVVKNVTGYDLSKLMAGSWGTLAVMTDVTIKVLPRPETEATVLLYGLDDAAAGRAMTAAVTSSCDVSGAAHLPVAAAGRVALGEASGSGRAVTALRLEGVAPSVAHRKAALAAQLAPFVETTTIEDVVSRGLWRAIRDVVPFGAARSSPERPLWRIVTAPSKGVALACAIGTATDAEVLYDWGGGLVWVLLSRPDDVEAAVVRAAVAGLGGHATLMRASAAARAMVDVFEPQEPALAALTKRVKEGFDPQRILNPGRMS